MVQTEDVGQKSDRKAQRSFHLRLALACGLLLAGALILLADLVWQSALIKNLGLLLLVLSAGGYYFQRWRDRQRQRRARPPAGEAAPDPDEGAVTREEKDEVKHD